MGIIYTVRQFLGFLKNPFTYLLEGMYYVPS